MDGIAARGRHRRGLCLAALICVAALSPARSGTASARPPGLPGTWRMAFHDDFGGRHLDRRLWQPNRYGRNEGGDAPFSPDVDDAWFSERNVHVRHGKLVLTIQRRPRSFQGRTFTYSSGVVETRPPFAMRRPAYLEARVRLPRCSGCWPAFWTQPPNRWPPEIDIFELFGDGRPEFNYHPPGSGQTGPTPYGRPGVDYRGRYHVFGLLWDKTKAVPYVDGRRYPGATSDITAAPQAIILNLSVLRGGSPAPGSEMRVDWVRVWRRMGQPRSSS